MINPKLLTYRQPNYRLFNTNGLINTKKSSFKPKNLTKHFE